MSEAIRLPGSPFGKPSNYRPSTIAGRLLNGETITMAKDKTPAPATTPVPPAPNGTVRSPFNKDVVTPVESIPPIPNIDFGPAPVLADHFGQPEFDATKSSSPDEQDSHKAEPQDDDKQPEPVKTGEPPHWWQDEGQRGKFEAFANGTLNDFDLMDRNERGELIDWTLANYLVKHGLEPATFVTFTAARDGFYAIALNDFKDDLRAIAKEKGSPIETRNDLHAFIGYYTIEDALQKMVGKGIRAAICGKLAAIEAERHVAQVNGTAQREQPAPAQTAPAKPEPQYVPLDEDALPPAEITVAPSQLTVIHNKDNDEQMLDLPADSSQRIVIVRNNHDLIRAMLQMNALVKDIDYGDPAGGKKKVLYKPGAEKLVTAFNLQAVPVLLPDTAVEWKNEFFYFHYQYQIYHRESGVLIASANGSCNSMESKYRWRWIDQTELVENGYKPDGLKCKTTIASEFTFAVDKAETTGKFGKPLEYWQMFKDAIASNKAVRGKREIKSGEERPTWEIVSKEYRVPNDDIPSIVNTIDKMAQKRALVAAVLISTAASAYFTQDIEDMPNFGSIETVA
jgi:hypothetical protein